MKMVFLLQQPWRYDATFRIVLLLIFCLLTGIACPVLAKDVDVQKKVLSINLKDRKVAEVLAEIEKQSDFRFFYNSELVDVNRLTSVKVEKKTVLAVLAQLFAHTDVAYQVVGTDVILKRKLKNTDVSLVSAGVEMQDRTISGVVTEEGSTTPVAGVSVLLKGTTVGTVTDKDGKFQLQVPNGEAILVFVYMGYSKWEETVGSRNQVNIAMRPEMFEMDEVVAIGYGTVKRANLGGAVSTLDAKTFESRPIRNAASALQGQAPGLTVTRSGGAPGSSPRIRVRDASSINGGSPLVLIDGAEGDINQLNPADIENISVLKDGTAAIYGARAADGVILVTTKGGKKNQEMRIAFDAMGSIKTPALVKRAANLYQHAEMALEISDGSFPIEYTREELQLILDGSDEVLPASRWGRWTGYPKFYKNQDWNEHIIGNGSLQNYNLNLTGGGEKYTYMLSLGHPREIGIPKFGVDNDKRYYVRAKSTVDIRPNLHYDFNLAYEAASRNYSSAIEHGQNLWELIYKTRSWAPVYNPAGNFYTFEGFDNPAQVLADGGLSTRTLGNLTFNNQLSWQATKDLNIVGRAVVRKNDQDNAITQKMLYSRNWEDVNHRIARRPNSAERNYQKMLYKNFTAYADYKKTLGKHDIGVMVGTAHESSDYDRFWARRINFDQQESMPLNLGSPQDQVASGEGNAWTINSFFSRVNYAFNNKYILEATIRADGSSRFDPDTRWGYFPGVNLTWRLAEESFIKKWNVFDDLKLRGSYGEMGNQSGIGPYDYIERISIQNDYYPFGNAQRGQMARQSNLVSANRTWETVISKNVGIDFGFLNGKLYGSADYFWKTNGNMLIPVTYPSALGIAAPSTNSGRLEIKGWELALGWRDQVGEFGYSVRANLSDAQNKVANRVGNNLISLGYNQTPLGFPIDSYFGYVFDGIIQNEEQLQAYRSRFPNEGIIQTQITVGDAMYQDLDGDGRLTTLGDGSEGAGDVVYLGNTNPRYNFGLNLSANYKGFDFTAFIQGIGQRVMFLEGEASMPFFQPWFQSAEYWYGKTWTPERTDAQYPAITMLGKRSYNYAVSDNTRHKMAYARLKNLQIGYSLPKRITEKWKMERVRIFFSGEDLFEVHNAPGGWDPEDTGRLNADRPFEERGGYLAYPFTRSYALGLNVIF